MLNKKSGSPRRTYRTLPIEGLIKKIQKPILKNGGGVFYQIFAEWPTIVGKEFAQKYTPLRLSSKRQGAVLSLGASQDVLFLAAYDKLALIQKLERYMGFRAVTDVTFGIYTPAVKAAPRLERMLSSDEQHEIQSAVALFEENHVSRALVSFATSLYKNQSNT